MRQPPTLPESLVCQANIPWQILAGIRGGLIRYTPTPVHGPTLLGCRPHFARKTNRIFNILSVIYAPSWSASVRHGCVCRSTTDSTGGG